MISSYRWNIGIDKFVDSIKDELRYKKIVIIGMKNIIDKMNIQDLRALMPMSFYMTFKRHMEKKGFTVKVHFAEEDVMFTITAPEMFADNDKQFFVSNKKYRPQTKGEMYHQIHKWRNEVIEEQIKNDDPESIKDEIKKLVNKVDKE